MRSLINYRAKSSTQPARWTPFSGWKMAHPLLVFLALLAWSIWIRGPFFGRDYIDKDESTFVHMGTSWAEGHLPYTELWDLKPPMTFAYFAGVVGLFGQHLWLIRLIGAALVAAVGYSTYRLIRIHTREITAQVLGALTVALLSLFGSVQGVMSEHIALFFWTPGVWALIYSTLRSTQYKTALIWCAGIMLSLSVATKLNMAYSVLGLIVPWMISFRNTRQIIQLALGVRLAIPGPPGAVVVFGGIGLMGLHPTTKNAGARSDGHRAVVADSFSSMAFQTFT
jgi:4-amino-4-deoxy-L-arabinose transferase-like glycosyltransferase